MATRVTGIGGIFIKSKEPNRLKAWYREHLGLDIQEWGGTTFRWQTPERAHPERAHPAERAHPEGATVWSVFDAKSNYFDPSTAAFMVNYRVENLHDMLDTLRAGGCSVDAKTEESEFGKFGWVMDPDGNKIELWEPPARFPG